MKTRNELPLREPTFFILLSLSDSPLHGYAIVKEVEALSNEKIRLSNSTLYGALARLLDQGLIERVETAAADQNGRERKEYRLTPDGLETLRAETHRMQMLVEAANLRLREVG